MQEIFKVQLPVSSNVPNPSALIYNEDRSIEEHLDVNLVKQYFIGNEMKVFIYGVLTDEVLHLEGRAPYQEW